MGRKLGAKDPHTTVTQEGKSAAPQRLHSSHEIVQESGNLCGVVMIT